MYLIAVLWMSPQTKPVQQNTLASSRSCVDSEETASQSWIKRTEETMEYFPLQGMSAVVILVFNNQSGALIFHTSITPDTNIRKLRNEQFFWDLTM